MEIFPRTSFLTLVLVLIIKVTQSISEDKNNTEVRRGRVNGRIVKLYSGTKPDPVLCLNEGFKADPVDCTVFYRCTKATKGKYNVFRFKCGPGTVYDPESEICNHPSNTKRSECGGKIQIVMRDEDNDIEGQELPSPISTASSIYSNQIEPKNVTEFSSTTQFTDYKPTATFSYQLLTTTDQKYLGNSNYLPTYQWMESQNETQNIAVTFTTIAPNAGKSYPCTSDGFVGDSDSCRKFYRCVSNSRGGFVSYEFSCSESTVWDEDMQSCNHVWAVRSRCGRSDILKKNSSNDLGEFFVNTSQSKPLQNTSQIKVEDHKNYEYNDVYDETSSKYGNRLNDNQQSTPNNQEVSYIGTQNKSTENQETINKELYFESNKLINYETTVSSPIFQKTYISKESGNDRSNKCIQSGFIADSSDCKKFYRCVDNGNGGFTKYEFSCSQQTVWDKSIEACNHPWAVKECGGKLLPETSMTTPNSIPTSVSTSTVSSIKEEIDYSYMNNINQEYTQTTSSTVLTTISLILTTEESKSPISECSSSGFFGDPNDCRKFYRCVDTDKDSYIRYDYKCGDGTLWDKAIESCNHAWAVKTCGQINTNITTSTSQSNDLNVLTTSTSVPISQTPSTEYNQNYDDSGYNNQPSIFSTTPDAELSKTTFKNHQMQKNKCQSNGFIGDFNDCKKFYRCVDNGNGGFTQFEYTCGEGTAWDSEIEACNHAWAVKECGNKNSMPNVNDVSLKPTETSEYEEENGYVSQNNITPDNVVTTTSTHSPTATIVISNNESECKANGFIGDKNSCKKFYRCVDNGNGGFTKHEFSCGEGTAWDSKIEACNHEWAVESCSSHSVTQQVSSSQGQNDAETIISSSSFVTEIQQSQTPIYSTISTSVTEENYLNSKDNECASEGFFADPNDCKKFFRCVNDGKGGYNKFVFLCGEGTVWIQEIQSCDHDTDVNCKGIHGITTTVKYEVNTSTDNSIESHIENESEANKPDSDEINRPNHCVSEGFYPNLNDCQHFYRCVDNGDGHYTKYEFTCAEGTAWDIKIGSCNYINEVDCKGLQIKPIMQDEQVSESDQNISTEKTTLKTTTASKTTSLSTTRVETTTTSTTTMKTTSKSTTAKSTTQHTKPQSKKVCDEDGYYGNTQDCHKFYRCVSNEKGHYTKYDYTCGEGTIWDQDITACNHPQDVTNPSCKSQQESTSATTSSSMQHTTDSKENISETTTSSSSMSTSSSNNNETNSNCSNNANTTESLNLNNNNNLITCKKAGFYADPSDCKKFYRCVDWDNNGEKFSIFHFECGEGTIWDPDLETCNYENSVYPPRNCSDLQQQNENSTEPSSTTESTSTTNEDFTTSSQQTTPKQITTTEQSTTIQTTTEQLTTQKPQATTTQSSTEQSTTPQTTTQQSTTQNSTTQQPTTQQSTTQQSTTQQSTIQQSTTQESTTQTSVTDKSTTQQLSESTQTTGQTTQEQTTKSSTEQITSTEATLSNTMPSTTESSDQTSSTESSTQQLTTGDNTSQTESSVTDASTTENQIESSTESNTSNDKCPNTEEDQYLFVCPTSFKRHPKYCNLFYQCAEDNDSYEMKVAVFQCPNNTIYDESKVQCVEESKSDKKCNGQIAQKHRVKRVGIVNNEPIFVTKDSMSCPTTGHFPFEKHEKCSAALLKCETTKSGKLRGYVYRCPEGYTYWSISRRCEPLKKLKDCKKPSELWTRRYDIPTEKYNIGN